MIPEVIVDDDCTRTVAITPTISPNKGFLTIINYSYFLREHYKTSKLQNIESQNVDASKNETLAKIMIFYCIKMTYNCFVFHSETCRVDRKHLFT
jgi:hypothetical protein